MRRRDFALHRESACRPKRSGKKPRGGRAVCCFRGATPHRIANGRCSASITSTRYRSSPPWILLLLAAAPTVFTTWPATWRRGCRIGLDSTTTPTCRAEIPPDRRAVATRASAAVPGRARLSCFAPRPAAASVRINARPLSAFAVRNRPSQTKERDDPEGRQFLKLPDCLVACPSQTYQKCLMPLGYLAYLYRRIASSEC